MASPSDALSGASRVLPIDKTSRLVTAAQRLDSIDLLRGLVMVIMAIDHQRDYMTWRQAPPEILFLHNSLAEFLTRWITHFCAPTFFFLAGTGAYLMLGRRTKAEVSRFLWTRGLWLCALEWTVVWFGWTFIPIPIPNMIVIMALGVCMIILSQLIRIPLPWLTALSLAVIGLHNLLLDGIDPSHLPTAGRIIYTLLHAQGFLKQPPNPFFMVLYPIVPWFAVMSAGYCFGAVVRMNAADRVRYTAWIGAATTALFIALRGFNHYGNSSARALAAGPWEHMKTPAITFASFLNVTKYPPSLDFVLMTIGPALLALALFMKFQWGAGWLGRKIVVFGRVPMFYYLCHLYVVHLVAIAFAAGFHEPFWNYIGFNKGAFFLGQAEPGYGFNLPGIYAAWAISIFILYFPCAWYARYKAEHKDNKWLSYL